jgi:hypothetical protein
MQAALKRDLDRGRQMWRSGWLLWRSIEDLVMQAIDIDHQVLLWMRGGGRRRGYVARWGRRGRHILHRRGWCSSVRERSSEPIVELGALVGLRGLPVILVVEPIGVEVR